MNIVRPVYSFNNTTVAGVSTYDNKSSNSNNNPLAIDFESTIRRMEETATGKWVSNPDFVIVDNQSGKIVYGSASFWNYTD